MNGSVPVPDDAPNNLRLGTCQHLLRWAVDRAESWTSDKDLDASDLIIVTFFVRSGRTYEAIVRCLGESGFGEQAQMLNRSLFEDMIDAHWVSLNRELALKRLEQHDLYSRLLRADTQRKFPGYYDGPPPPIKVSNEERRELRSLFGRTGSGSWTGVRSLDDRVQAVKGCWRSEDQQSLLLWWAAWVHKTSNELLHPSALSLARIGSPKATPTGGLEWRFGSTRHLLPHALSAAFYTFSNLVGLIVGEFAPHDTDNLAELVRSAEDSFSSADRWEDTGVFDDPSNAEAEEAK